MTGNKRKIGAFLLMLIVLVSGCGRQPEQGGQDAANQNASAGLGRYMESVFELPQDMNRNGGIN